MTTLLIKLLDDISNKKIDKISFLNKFRKETGLTLDEDYCLAKLALALDSKKSDKIDIYISVAFIIGFTNKSTPILCQLLLSEVHYNHEDLARLLKDISDPKAVDCIYNAAEIQFDYLDYDDTYQFARKCIKALAAIGDDNAISKLRLLLDSKIPEIAEYAKKELYYKVD